MTVDKDFLSKTAQKMVADFKGILAIDESSTTCKKRFDSIGVESSEENRRKYRSLLVSAKGVENYISGYILFDETIRQKDDNGFLFSNILKDKNILVGIKVDTGAKDLAFYNNEKVTEGLDGLRERLKEYKKLNASFTKWRAVIKIDKNQPTDFCIKANTHALARYAALVQESGMVPMVEPEILMDGDHNIDTCYSVSKNVLDSLFIELKNHNVYLPGVILKTNMILSGKDSGVLDDDSLVAKKTIDCFLSSVSKEIPGIMFLSGGQSDYQSTSRLNEINKVYKDLPWKISFSYGRGIQKPVLKQWNGDNSPININKSQEILVHRSKMNYLANKGEYDKNID